MSYSIDDLSITPEFSKDATPEPCKTPEIPEEIMQCSKFKKAPIQIICAQPVASKPTESSSSTLRYSIPERCKVPGLEDSLPQNTSSASIALISLVLHQKNSREPYTQNMRYSSPTNEHLDNLSTALFDYKDAGLEASNLETEYTVKRTKALVDPESVALKTFFTDQEIEEIGKKIQQEEGTKTNRRAYISAPEKELERSHGCNHPIIEHNGYRFACLPMSHSSYCMHPIQSISQTNSDPTSESISSITSEESRPNSARKSALRKSPTSPFGKEKRIVSFENFAAIQEENNEDEDIVIERISHTAPTTRNTSPLPNQVPHGAFGGFFDPKPIFYKQSSSDLIHPDTGKPLDLKNIGPRRVSSAPASSCTIQVTQPEIARSNNSNHSAKKSSSRFFDCFKPLFKRK